MKKHYNGLVAYKISLAESNISAWNSYGCILEVQLTTVEGSSTCQSPEPQWQYQYVGNHGGPGDRP